MFDVTTCLIHSVIGEQKLERMNDIIPTLYFFMLLAFYLVWKGCIIIIIIILQLIPAVCFIPESFYS